MKAKKIILIGVKFICFNIVLIVAFIMGSYLWVISHKTYEPPFFSYEFYKSEMYLNSDPFILFSKYYYYENPSEMWSNDYMLIENNVETVKTNISTSLNKLHELDNAINIEFNYDIITSNDYYFLKTIKDENLILLYYYDVDEHILYTTYFPNYN